VPRGDLGLVDVVDREGNAVHADSEVIESAAHSLRGAAITNPWDAGVPRRAAQFPPPNADLRTTEHYDRARGSLHRHGVHILTSYVADCGTACLGGAPVSPRCGCSSPPRRRPVARNRSRHTAGHDLPVPNTGLDPLQMALLTMPRWPGPEEAIPEPHGRWK
jgi:hypothetical protein